MRTNQSGVHIRLDQSRNHLVFVKRTQIMDRDRTRTKRCSFEVTIRTTLQVIIFERRKVINRFVKCHGKPSCRIIIAKDTIRDSSSSLLSWVPRIKDRIDVLILPVHCKVTPVCDNNDQRLACRLKLFYKFFLISRKVEACPITPLKPGSSTDISSPSSRGEIPATAIRHQMSCRDDSKDI